MFDTELKVEYLVIIDVSNSFCANEDAFNNIFRTTSEITLENNIMKFKNLEIEYKVQTKNLETGESGSNNKRFFHVHFKCLDASKITIFEELLRVVRDLLNKTSEIHQTLWDDVSFYYSCKAYPLIHEIENLMRKLITKFMLTNVGLAWTKDNIPEEVKNSVRNTKKDEKVDYLYKTDFIQLANFLFEKYSPLTINDLIDKIRDVSDLEELNLSEMKEYVPKSNWERYFAAIVKCEAEYLKKRWERLYNLRNQIAHNSMLKRTEYDEIARIVSELKIELEKAIEGLDKIQISNEDKEIVAENLATGSDNITHDFITEYKFIEKILKAYAGDFGDYSGNIRDNLKTLEDKGIIDKQTKERILSMHFIRNMMVHNSEVILNQVDVESYTIECKELKNVLGKQFLKSRKEQKNVPVKKVLKNRKKPE